MNPILIEQLLQLILPDTELLHDIHRGTVSG